ncbi:MAG: hypothetical protein HY370_10355 [Proteobacteria bacterium]|nr:hypothetical protein [Pseudomonadota bacterium]
MRLLSGHAVFFAVLVFFAWAGGGYFALAQEEKTLDLVIPESPPQNDEEFILNLPKPEEPPLPGQVVETEKKPDKEEKGRLKDLKIEETPGPPRAEDLLAGLPPAIQMELMNESEQAFTHCNQNFMLPRFYECSCFALKFMEARIKSGPDVNFFNLITDMNYGECVFTPAIAGNGFDRCYELMYLQNFSDEILNKICECTGRGMAESFSRNPVADMEYADGLFRNQLSDCRAAITR